MKKAIVVVALVILAGCSSSRNPDSERVDGTATLSREVLQDKIKGAWAAQTIGVTFGRPAEFQYNSTMIQDNQKLEWHDSSMVVEFREKPGTYDDIYMDLSFITGFGQLLIFLELLSMYLSNTRNQKFTSNGLSS